MAEAVLELIDNEDFRDADKRQEFLKPMDGFEELCNRAKATDMTIDSMCSVPLLKFYQEQYLFRQYNCLKFIALRGEEAHDRIRDLLQVLFMCNVRLIVRFLKSKGTPSISFMTHFSDCTVALIRAINLFDFSRGNKFSTYASWALRRRLAETYRRERDSRTVYFGMVPAEPTYSLDFDAKEQAVILNKLFSCLDEREEVIVRNYLLSDHKVRLEDIGVMLGITKQRVQQLKKRAFEKLQESAMQLVGAI
jgi:RNA polymerase sigma factor (sigma-70 family)